MNFGFEWMECDATDSIAYFVLYLLVMAQMLWMHKLLMLVLMVLVLLLLMMMLMMGRLKFHFMIAHAIVFGRMHWTEWCWNDHSVLNTRLMLHHVRLHVFIRRMKTVVHDQIGRSVAVDRRRQLVSVRHRRQTVMIVLWRQIVRVYMRCWWTVLICDRCRNLGVNGVWHWR